MKLTIVTGGRGAGKTSYMRGCAEDALAAGRRVGGVISVAVFEGDRRVGYDLLDPGTGDRRCLAREVERESRGLMIGSYLFEEESLEYGCRAIMESVRDGVDMVVIDEVGPLECRGDGWAKALRGALEECVTDQELCLAVRPSLVGELPKVFPSSAWCRARYVRPPWPEKRDV